MFEDSLFLYWFYFLAQEGVFCRIDAMQDTDTMQDTSVMLAVV